MVGDLIVLLNGLDFVSDDGSLFLENTDGSVNFDPDILFEFEVLKSFWLLAVALLIENDFLRFRIVIDFEKCPHCLLLLVDQATNNDNILDGQAIDLQLVIGSTLSHFDHLD